MGDKISDTCIHVEDGDTFVTKQDKWICLARVNAPVPWKPGYEIAKSFLRALILNKIIEYQQVGTSSHRIVAEVWHGGFNINDKMISYGYAA